MTDVSVENGTLTVSNMVSRINSKEVISIEQTDNYGNTVSSSDAMLEDQFDLSLEYDMVIKWAVANQTCQTAMQMGTTMYACRSSHSDCLRVIHGIIFMGYRCKCSAGYQGNPYIENGCTGLILLTALHCALQILFYNLFIYIN